jgi:hypothetical protein
MKNFQIYTSEPDDQIFYIHQPETSCSQSHWFKLKPGWISVMACYPPNRSRLELVREIEARNITDARRRFQKELRGEVAILPDF